MLSTRFAVAMLLAAASTIVGCSPAASNAPFGRKESGTKHPLVGRAMPAFESTLLDGTLLRSTDLQGKIVVLDFWATWCPPCVAALPKIAAVTERYREQGVVFYAVNLRESAKVVQSFLASQGLAVPVLLDQSGLIGGLFEVSGIPQTVIVDRQGAVRVVHVGAGPDVGDVLTADLEKLLAAKP